MIGIATVQPIEVVWTLIALSGVYPAYYNVKTQATERKALIAKQINHGAVTFATGWLWIEILVLACQLSLVAVGVLAAGLPHTESADLKQSFIRLAIPMLLFFISICVTTRSWISWRIKVYVYDYGKVKMDDHYQGPKGEAGTAGITGQQGTQGVQGIQGTQGAQGVHGDKGEPG